MSDHGITLEIGRRKTETLSEVETLDNNIVNEIKYPDTVTLAGGGGSPFCIEKAKRQSSGKLYQ